MGIFQICKKRGDVHHASPLNSKFYGLLNFLSDSRGVFEGSFLCDRSSCLVIELARVCVDVDIAGRLRVFVGLDRAGLGLSLKLPDL